MKPLPKLLTWMATIVVVSLFLLVAVMGWLSRDIPAPDTSDLVPEKIELPADQNAFAHFLAATKKLDWPAKSDSVVRDYLADKPADETVLRDLVARNAATLEEIRLGLECQRCIIPESERMSATTPWKSIGSLLELKARLEHRAGDHAGATGTCVALLQFGNLIQRDADSGMFFLIGNVKVHSGLTAARRLVADPALPPADLTRLAAALDQLGPFGQSLIRATKGDFQYFANAIGRGDWLDPGELDQAAKLLRNLMPAFLLQPNRTKLAIANTCRETNRDAPLNYASMSRAPGDESGKTKLNPMRPNRLGWSYSELVVRSQRMQLEKKCRIEADVAATRLLAACRAYQVAESRLPETLAALVPKYLAAVPADPFDGKPFRYRPDPCVVYSVGKDLKDSGGSMKLPYARTYSPTRRWDAEDAVFEFNPAPPAPVKSSR